MNFLFVGIVEGYWYPTGIFLRVAGKSSQSWKPDRINTGSNFLLRSNMRVESDDFDELTFNFSQGQGTLKIINLTNGNTIFPWHIVIFYIDLYILSK